MVLTPPPARYLWIIPVINGLLANSPLFSWIDLASRITPLSLTGNCDSALWDWYLSISSSCNDSRQPLYRHHSNLKHLYMLSTVVADERYGLYRDFYTTAGASDGKPKNRLPEFMFAMRETALAALEGGNRDPFSALRPEQHHQRSQ